MIKKIDHIVITVNDIDRCFLFYESLGFISKKNNGRYELFARNFKINVHIRGEELSPHAQNIAVGSADICFEIDEHIESFKRHLENIGIKIELGIIERMGAHGKMDSIYLYDPDGNLLEFSYLHIL